MTIKYVGKIKQDGVITFIYPDGDVESLEMYIRDKVGSGVFNGMIIIDIDEGGNFNA